MDYIDSYTPILEAGIYVVLFVILLAIVIILWYKGGIPLLHGVDSSSLSEGYYNPLSGRRNEGYRAYNPMK